MNETIVVDYKIFEAAHEDSNKLMSELEEEKQNVLNSKQILCSNDVFAGPVADTCKEALDLLDQRVLSSIENFNTIGKYFEEVKEAYQKGDEKASKLILTQGKDGKITTTTSGLTGDTNEDKIFNYFKSKGLTDAEACGIMACIYHESRFLPGAERTVPGDESIGICQWLAERRTALENYCKENGKEVTDLEAQLDFIFYECETTQKVAAMNNLKAITEESADAAAAAADRWLIDYEGVGRSKKSYQAHSDMRQKTARELYQRFHQQS